MALRFVKKKALPIGVDLGSSSVKLAQLRYLGEDIELIAAANINIPRDSQAHPPSCSDFVAKLISETLKVNHFNGNQCILSLPAEATIVHHVKMPKLPPAETANALRIELEGKLPCPVDDAIIRHIVAGDAYGDGKDKQEVIAVCTPRQTLDAYLAMSRRARLDVVGVNIEPFAIVECFDRLFRRAEDEARTILFLDMGAASTQVVMTHGCKIAFARNLNTGGQKLDEAVAEGLGIPVDQANALRSDLAKGKHNLETERELYHLMDQPLAELTDELTQCLRYYESVFRNQTIERAIFVGGQAYDKRLCQTLAQRLSLPAQIGDPLARIRRLDGAGMGLGLDRREPHPGWAVAVGLSIGAHQAA